MPVIETSECIIKTMDNLIDFIVKDDFIVNQFENFFIIIKIEISKD